ncbi:MAG: hypothetical protein AB8F94_27090 [Saprospiraceae bacterium]
MKGKSKLPSFSFPDHEYSAIDWLNYVRGTLPENQKKKMLEIVKRNEMYLDVLDEIEILLEEQNDNAEVFLQKWSINIEEIFDSPISTENENENMNENYEVEVVSTPIFQKSLKSEAEAFYELQNKSSVNIFNNVSTVKKLEREIYILNLKNADLCKTNSNLSKLLRKSCLTLEFYVSRLSLVGALKGNTALKKIQNVIKKGINELNNIDHLKGGMIKPADAKVKSFSSFK